MTKEDFGRYILKYIEKNYLSVKTNMDMSFIDSLVELAFNSTLDIVDVILLLNNIIKVYVGTGT